MRIEPDHVLAAKMNAHRHQWNGTICSQPQSWNCGADASFRANYCDSGVPRCFHLDVFKPGGPRFVTPDSSVLLALQQQPTVLDDQVLLFYGGQFGVRQGIAPGDYEQTLFGFYRVKQVNIDTGRAPHRLVIEPHPDSWAMFPRMNLRPSALRAVPGVAYLKQFRAKGLRDAIDEALEAAASLPKSEGWTPDLHRRLQGAAEALPEWLRQAEQAMARLTPAKEASPVYVSSAIIEGSLAAKLRDLNITTAPLLPAAPPVANGSALPEASAPTTAATAHQERAQDDAPTQPVPAAAKPGAGRRTRVASRATSIETPEARSTGAPSAAEAAPCPAEPLAAKFATTQTGVAPRMAKASQAAPADVPSERLDAHASRMQRIPEPEGRQVLLEQFGAPLVDALSVAFHTKSLVILTGAPGAGKSWIASRLLDDADRERTVIVPVASTWRGREDLLGYVNPITGRFEASEFTHFLCDAQDAWELGDRRPRIVVFEEFNLSQPEHWLSDLLVRLEYDADQLADRTVRLGGQEIAGRAGRACSVVLVPSLRFAATLNNDHTVKPLSHRVLDRAALIEVTNSGRAALLRAGVELGDDMEAVIDDLNDLLEPRGAAFSVRSARSLQRATDAGAISGMGLRKALDLVLAQEVLSRVRLLAGDPRDEQLLSRLRAWTQKPGCAELTTCATRISDWADLLSVGRDVFQA